jgi:hypothetical protein
VPFFRAVFDPVLELTGDVTQKVSAHRVELAIGVKEPHHRLRLLEGLDQAVQENAVEAPIVESDVILVMLVEGVHGQPPRW